MDLKSLEIPLYIAEKIHHPGKTSLNSCFLFLLWENYIKNIGSDGVKIRRIFNNISDFDEDEIKLINDVKKMLEVEKIEIPPKYYYYLQKVEIVYIYI